MGPNDSQAVVYPVENRGSIGYSDSEKPERDARVILKGYAHIFSPWTNAKWGFPNFYRKPGFGYQKLAQYRHRDFMDRIHEGDLDDRYISSWDGMVSKLVVQATDDIYENNTGSTYRRTFIRNVSPIYMRLANWPFNHIDPTKNNGKPTNDELIKLCAKWFLASCAITMFISSPSPAQIEARNNGNYDCVPYHWWGYSKVAKNMIETDHPRKQSPSQANPVAERILCPRFLCFLREEGRPAEIMAVDRWTNEHKHDRELDYIFIAYTAEQFNRPEDFKVLHEMADAAARNAGVIAYWVGCSCMPDGQLEEDVYRICDVIRGAKLLAIAVGPPPNNSSEINTPALMLQQWGRRVWTFPEVLLAPAGKEIRVYVRGSDLSRPRLVAKNQFAAEVWLDDAKVARQLIDHYEGNLLLNQLELVTLALECLHNRDTEKHFQGDHSYALMGLLRIRPQIDPSDSAFQAFARLSLANGSDQLLERLFCLLPTSPNAPWHSMSDSYNAKLWDILPQDVGIAGVGEDDSIILDGCRAANVRWKSFTPVAYLSRDSWRRMFSRIMLRSGGVVFLVAIGFVGAGGGSGTLFTLGVVLLVYSLILMALAPWLLRLLYLGKFWDQQCWFFGFEGYMNLETIETQIFGGRLGRMKWTAAASPLSRHERNRHNECIPLDPTSDPAVAALVEQAKRAGPGDQRIFTLVDTGNMTATLFLAERPPVCFLMAGSEGGMKRIIGCSYDWTTQTMYRETVLRIGTQFDDKMSRVGRVKISLKRRQNPVAPLAQVGEAVGGRVN
ncbi:hypothetical protein PtrSN002B_008479 [Pyrenophora tritici-repentis]|uniref:Uncharacterized protein n=2 Tax=Pyrenophora tritici-repentis TaxID=45151 RepID=A0A2W1HWJ0_9PLEO|nr:uncharacterized protein PTRG_04013 [Pyrenophora tritici-repentis Pt-1C-BFP]KAA8619915.1 hypothetical protein PtrV1_07009 [Pyrenophora tritici-repentis]EDU46851.1 conserved hypothetical protein [Pyrenophora tritici-repentis Pt-1C-BFP]KAF7448059.1 hypothetical protein A1F99_074230 [Pyrenophora tritici-repentis]KAF7571763.1 hypothetical protein PtrM4_092630 [Pyrenophora tritici-repentis]KAG9385028.1 hypothetical protein A1F94_004575 [Pyrenophora tritici-repentis]